MKMKAKLAIGIVLLASFGLALAVGTGRLSPEKAAQTNNQQPKNQKDFPFLDLCNEKKTIALDLIPSVGACTEMACSMAEPCCNSCPVFWKIKGTDISAWGAGLPVCEADGCGKYLSPACKETNAKGLLKNCDNLFTMVFEVSTDDINQTE